MEDNEEIPRAHFENIDIKLETLSDVIEGFNPNWNEDVDTDIKFMEAINIARAIFDNKIQSIIAKCSAKMLVEEAIEKSQNGILILDKFMPYQEFVLESDNPSVHQEYRKQKRCCHDISYFEFRDKW